MTNKQQSEPVDHGLDDIWPAIEGPNKSSADDSEPVDDTPPMPFPANPPLPMAELRATAPLVLDGLFGKRNWVKKWVRELCEADPQFAFYLADRPRGYVHFMCLVRLDLQDRDEKYMDEMNDDDEEDEFACLDAEKCAQLIRSTGKKALLKQLFPSEPGGLHKVLPKLPKKPLARKDYRKLLHALRITAHRERFSQAERIRKRDIRLVDVVNELPEGFRGGEVMHSIKCMEDYLQFGMLVRAAELIGFKITEREVSEINLLAQAEKDMRMVTHWFFKRFAELPFPPPPWEGNVYINPLRSREELRTATEDLEEHFIDHHAEDVVFGESYYYVHRDTDAVIQLKRDAFFGWVIAKIHPNEEYEVTRAQRNEICRMFSRSDIGCPDNYPGVGSPRGARGIWRLYRRHPLAKPW